MLNVSLNIAWSIAEIETSAAGFQSILPNYFWIGCCKGCDLDLVVQWGQAWFIDILGNQGPECKS